jgi:sugar lactone lactonase YvrE
LRNTTLRRTQYKLLVLALFCSLLSFVASPAKAAAPTSTTCAQGGVCQVGDIGPGGGKVFYVAPTTFTQVGATAGMCTTNCKYLEAAPKTWSGGTQDPSLRWSAVVNQDVSAGPAELAIGSGFSNSLAIMAQSGNIPANSAAAAARAYTGTNNLTDWFLPSAYELSEMSAHIDILEISTSNAYWSSTQDAFAANEAIFAYFSAGLALTKVKSNSFLVRPIRAFAPATKIAITRASVGTERRTAFTTQPKITIQYSNNDTATVSSAVVTATISSGGTLIGTTTATASSGVATFSNLGVDGTIGTTYTISYTALDLPLASATVTLTGTNCNGTTFACQVGDIGPGGGKIFYVAPTTFTQPGATGYMCSTACKYLEAAPTSGANAWPDNNSGFGYEWSGKQPFEAIGTTATAIGTGYSNTLAMVLQSNTPGKAGTAARAYRGPNNLTDWFLPSKDELGELASKRLIVGLSERWYWSSSESSNNPSGISWLFEVGFQNQFLYNFKDASLSVRPIRAFGTAPATISIANVVIPAPVTGATPVTSLASNGQYTATISWSGSPTTFAASTAYTATVTVTPVAGYTLSGANSFTVNGNTANAVISSSTLATAGYSPFGIVTDAAGNIYTSNKNSNNVTKITPDGFASVLGTTGSEPFALIVDASGSVYTANIASNNVTKITAQGVSSTFGTTGNWPDSIAFDAAGNIYTANLFSGNVTKFTPQGAASSIGVTGAAPFAIAIDSAGNIFTVNNGSDNVTKTTPQGVSTIFGSTGSAPLAIAFDSAGNIYTANFRSSTVTKITPQGVSSTFGTTGSGPQGIAIDSAGNVYTANFAAGNVTKITPQGVSSILGSTGSYPTGIAIDTQGNIYTANYGSGDITKFSSTNSGVFTYRFSATTAPAPAAVYIAPTPVPYLKTLTKPKLNLKDGKLICTSGTYNTGYTLDGVVQGSGTALYTPSSLIYNLLINGVTQSALSVTTTTSTASWNLPAATSGSLISCSVTVSANGITNTDKSTDNAASINSALLVQATALSDANASYASAISANDKAYQKGLSDARDNWHKEIQAIRTNYYDTLARISSVSIGKKMIADKATALKVYIAAQKKSVADYKASQPAAASTRESANKAALDAKSAAVAKANATYGAFIESIGYGVLIL